MQLQALLHCARPNEHRLPPHVGLQQAVQQRAVAALRSRVSGARGPAEHGQPVAPAEAAMHPPATTPAARAHPQPNGDPKGQLTS